MLSFKKYLQRELSESRAVTIELSSVRKVSTECASDT